MEYLDRLLNPLSSLSRFCKASTLVGCLFAGSMFAQQSYSNELKVLASIRPVALLTADLVKGLPVTVDVLLPANADPHNWSMRISDRKRLADADLVVWLGSDFESFLAKPLKSRAAKTQLELGALSLLAWPGEEGHDDHAHDHHGHGGHHHHGRDMHLWLNSHNAVRVIEAVAERLSTLQPEWQALLAERLKAQQADLSQLESEIRALYQTHKTQPFIVMHDAYGHFVEQYGLHQLDAVNQSSEQRLSAKKLNALRQQAAQASCLMAEQSTEEAQRLARTLNLPLVIADGLANDVQQTSYRDFLWAIASAFAQCFQSVKQDQEKP